MASNIPIYTPVEPDGHILGSTSNDQVPEAGRFKLSGQLWSPVVRGAGGT